MSTRTKLSRPASANRIPASWSALTTRLPLRPIHDDVDWENAMEVIDQMAGHDMNRDQEDYLQALSTLVAAYEDASHAVDTRRAGGVRALRSLMQEHEMSAADLGRLLKVHRSHASKILNGDRSLTADHMRTLGAHFKVNPSLFM